ncbi:MAG: hypothetical protein KDK66_08270, partial [Deltaproteobacteria bacterium]|nr:hypothetical protein [Deltaproteobacteria bacterium]
MESIYYQTCPWPDLEKVLSYVKQKPGRFFLDSALPSQNKKSYSILGAEPLEAFSLKTEDLKKIKSILNYFKKFEI